MTINERAEMLRIQAHAYVNQKTGRVKVKQAMIEILGDSTPPRLRKATGREVQELAAWLARLWK
jgi:hypothetical protein